MSTFRRRQIGRASLVVSIISIISATLTHQTAPFAALMVILGAALMGYLFSSLTIESNGDTLKWWYSARFWRREIRLTDVQSVAICRTPLWYGWGIRKIARGWLYNVSGRDAVELTMRDGRRIVLGTDRPQQLAAVLGASAPLPPPAAIMVSGSDVPVLLFRTKTSERSGDAERVPAAHAGPRRRARRLSHRRFLLPRACRAGDGRAQSR